MQADGNGTLFEKKLPTDAAAFKLQLGLSTVASTGNYTDLAGRPTLATVASTGNYTDLSGRPTLGSVAALNLNTQSSYLLSGAGTWVHQGDFSVNYAHTAGGAVSATTAGSATGANHSYELRDGGAGVSILKRNLNVYTGDRTGLWAWLTGNYTLTLTGNSTLSGNNTGDQDLSGYATLAGNQTFTGNVTMNGTLTANGSALTGITSGQVSGLGGAALLNVGTTTGTVAAGDDSRIVAGGTALQPAAATTKFRTMLDPRVISFGVDRVYKSRGGTAVSSIVWSNTTWDDSGVAFYNNAATFDATTYAQFDIGLGFINYTSGANALKNLPNAFQFRSSFQWGAGSKFKIFLGAANSWLVGRPTGFGYGFISDINGIRGWMHDGVAFGATGEEATNIITATGHNFADGDSIFFSALTGGTGLAASTPYWVRDVSGNTFKLAATPAGAAIDFTTDISAATIPKLPTYTSAFAGLAAGVPGTNPRNLGVVNDGAGTVTFYASDSADALASKATLTGVPTTASTYYLIKATVVCSESSAEAAYSTGMRLMSASFYPFRITP